VELGQTGLVVSLGLVSGVGNVPREVLLEEIKVPAVSVLEGGCAIEDSSWANASCSGDGGHGIAAGLNDRKRLASWVGRVVVALSVDVMTESLPEVAGRR
jgi:hypothetical protein